MDLGYKSGVNLSELKEKVAGLSRKDRFQLSAFLDELEQETESEFREETSQRMAAMGAGQKMAAEEFEQSQKNTPRTSS